MCGVSFYCSPNKHLAMLEDSLLRTRHRGPDGNGILHRKIGDYNIGIGHNRLSILDLSDSGRQPMDLGYGVVISYNGEVYNHIELKGLLQSKGYSFKGHSDTEVILLLFVEFGIAAFSMLQGMFALVLLDEKANKLFVVRDNLGIKPMYLYHENEELYGCSEIRGLKAFQNVNTTFDREDIFEFFNNGFLYEPSTGYKHIKKLMPGHCLEFDLLTGGKILTNFSLNKSYEAKAVSTLSNKIEIATRQQMVADVPLGTFFSGGTDSSIIACYGEKNNLFFASFGADANSAFELEQVTKISEFLGKPLTAYNLASDNSSVNEILSSVDFVACNSEELISDYTFYATYKLSESARINGFKVMLSGMGGDEIFAGYPRYLILRAHKLIRFVSFSLKYIYKLGLYPKKLNKKFERLLSYSTEKHWPTAYARLLGYFSRSDLKDFFPDIEILELAYRKKLDFIAQSFKGNADDKLKLAQYFDLKGCLAHNLTVADKASMLASIELRVPLLNEAVVDHGLGLSTSELLNGLQLKYPLKTVLSTFLPKKIVERPKIGFNPPLDGLIKKIGFRRLKNEYEHIADIVNLHNVEFMLEQHFSGVENNTYKLWQLLYFSRWIKANRIVDASGNREGFELPHNDRSNCK